MKKSLSKKARKVIEDGVQEFMGLPPLTELTKIGARMMLQSALEEEVTGYLQRDFYERNAEANGSRSGSKPRTVKIGSGDIGLKMPQIINAGGPFHSRILAPRVTQMDEIQEIIPLLYMNGLSSRKVKKAVGKLIGKKGLSHQNVLRISSRIVEEFKAWKKRDLSTLQVIYLVLDAVRMGVRAGTKEKEAVLVAWAFLEDGSRELVGVSLGNSESYSAWKGFLEDLLKREMNVPMLTVIDGCPGLIRAVDEVLPESDKQRCTKHRTENVLDKVLEQDKASVKTSVRKVFYASTYEHAKEAVELFKKKWSMKYPSAVECLTENIEDCLTYYKYPYQHWLRIRTTNIVERSFKEVKRRVKVAGRFQNEERALTMVYWQLKELKWNGVSMTREAKAILTKIRTSRIQRIAA
ncbi:MAG: IS256 family transposase [Thermodesulfovibrionales bacterium]|nr:IS256 family transposase [Thermodesulfovibrionales bacterium]